MTRNPTLTLLAAAVFALAGCASTAPRTAPVAVAAAGVAADDNLNAVLWVQTAQEYRALTTQTWRAAEAQLDAALADPQWTALLPGEGAELQTPAQKPAVIVDIDETMLDNSAYQARLVVDGASYGSASWAAWVSERRATPVPGALAFAKDHPLALALVAAGAAVAGPRRLVRWAGVVLPLLMQLRGGR